MKRNNLSALLVFSVVFLLVITCVIPSVSLMNAEESDLILDNLSPSYVEGTEHKVEGIIPIGATAVVNGQDAEVFRKFKHTVKLKDDPSFTSVKIDLIDPSGETAESREVFIENKGILRLWMQQNNPKWTVDGAEDIFSVPPTMVKGSIMLPFRAIAEAFGATVEWIQITKTIVMELDDTRLEITLGSSIAKINGREVKLSVPMTIVNGSTLVPLRFVAEAFDAEVAWHSKDRSITIQKVIHPKPDDNQTPPLNIGNIFLDDPNPSVFEQTEYTIEGTIPFEHTVKINGEDAEIFRKFRQTIDIKEPPSFTPVDIEVSDSGGNIIEERTTKVENVGVLRMKFWIGETMMLLNGDERVIDVPAQIINGSTMMPVRFIAEGFEANVTWIPETKTIVIDYDTNKIELHVNNPVATVNGIEVILYQPAQIVDSRTMVPFRFIAEAFGSEVAWIADERAMTIEKKIYP